MCSALHAEWFAREVRSSKPNRGLRIFFRRRARDPMLACFYLLEICMLACFYLLEIRMLACFCFLDLRMLACLLIVNRDLAMSCSVCLLACLLTYLLEPVVMDWRAQAAVASHRFPALCAATGVLTSLANLTACNGEHEPPRSTEKHCLISI